MERKLKLLVVTLLSALLMISVVAPAPAPAQKPGPATLKIEPGKWPKYVQMGAAYVGSSGYRSSVLWIRLLNRYSEYPIQASVAAIGGTAARLKAIGNKIHFGEVGYKDIVNVWTGKYKGLPHVPVRLLFKDDGYGIVFFVRADSGIKSIPDIKGKKLTIYRTPIPKALWETAMKYYGITDKDYIRLQAKILPDVSTALAEGRADGGTSPCTLPKGHSKLVEVFNTQNLRLIPFSEKAVNYTLKKLPWTSRMVLEPGSLRGNPERYFMAGVSKPWFTTKDVPADLVYVMLKTLYEHYDEWVKFGPPWAKSNTLEGGEAASLDLVPYHPGAIAYFKEKGIWTKEMDKRQAALLAKEKTFSQ